VHPRSGNTALDLAIECGNVALCNFLRHNGAEDLFFEENPQPYVSTSAESWESDY
jgi:hypothetical protein